MLVIVMKRITSLENERGSVAYSITLFCILRGVYTEDVRKQVNNSI